MILQKKPEENKMESLDLASLFTCILKTVKEKQSNFSDVTEKIDNFDNFSSSKYSSGTSFVSRQHKLSVEILQTLNDENLSCKLLIILKLFILELRNFHEKKFSPVFIGQKKIVFREKKFSRIVEVSLFIYFKIFIQDKMLQRNKTPLSMRVLCHKLKLSDIILKVSESKI